MAAQAVRHQQRRLVAREQHLFEPRHPVAAPRPVASRAARRARSPCSASQRLCQWVGPQFSQPGSSRTRERPQRSHRHDGSLILRSSGDIAMKHRVFVDGQEGTTGLRIHEYLAQRSDIEVLRIDPEQAQGRRRTRAPAERRRRRVPVPARRRGARGRGAGHQPRDLPDRRQHGAPHRGRAGSSACPSWRRDQRDRLRASKRIANPGCHSQRLHPAAAPAGRRRPGAARRCRSAATSITGYSGGGKKMIEQYEAGGDARLDSPRPYGLTLAHKHMPEMMAHTGLAVEAGVPCRSSATSTRAWRSACRCTCRS